jgi:hypothetical protein
LSWCAQCDDGHPAAQAALPTLKSIVDALSANAGLLSQQQQQQAAAASQLEHAGSGGFATPHELAAFSAGIAAAQQQQQQQAAYEEAQQQQAYALQQHLAAQQAAQQEEWAAGISPELLAALGGQPGQLPGGGWAPRRRADHLPRAPFSTQAAAQMRARAALTGDPWLGEQGGGGGGAGAAYLPSHHPFAEAAYVPAAEQLGAPPAAWTEPAGVQQSFWGPAAEGMSYPVVGPAPLACMTCHGP